MFVGDVFPDVNKIKLKDKIKIKIKQYSDGWIASKSQAIFLTYFCCCFAIGSVNRTILDAATTRTTS